MRDMEETHLIPDDLVEEILQFLPIKSLARFICVSKKWRTMIFNQINNIKEEGFIVASPYCVRYFNLAQLSELKIKFVNLLQFPSKYHIFVIGSVNGLVLCLYMANRALILHNPLTQVRWTINCHQNPVDYSIHRIRYEKSKDDHVGVTIDRNNRLTSAQIQTSKTRNWGPSSKILDPEWCIYFFQESYLSWSECRFVHEYLYWMIWKSRVLIGLTFLVLNWRPENLR